MRKPALTTEELALLLQLAEAGTPTQELCERFDRCQSRISVLLREMGCERRNQNTKARRQVMADRYAAGEPTAIIATDMGVSLRTVRRAAMEFGHAVKRGRHARGLNRQQQLAAVRMSAMGVPLERIAKHFGRSTHIIKQTLRLHDPEWTGKPLKVRAGYVVRYISPAHRFASMGLYVADNKGARILEHRLVMAEHLGRPLSKRETVHHINGVRDDNRIENLELRQGQHGQGARFTCLDCGSHNVQAAKLQVVGKAA